MHSYLNEILLVFRLTANKTANQMHHRLIYSNWFVVKNIHSAYSTLLSIFHFTLQFRFVSWKMLHCLIQVQRDCMLSSTNTCEESYVLLTGQRKSWTLNWGGETNQLEMKYGEKTFFFCTSFTELGEILKVSKTKLK